MQLWTPKLIDLTERALRLFSSALPVIDGVKLRVSLGDSEFNLATPLIYVGRAIVVGGITPRKGIWKLNGQFLNMDVSDEVTLDLPSDTVFDVGVELGSLRFDLKDVEVGDRVQSVYYNVPVRQTDTFEGRTKELDTLKEWMEDEDTRFCLIYGDGGFGKTTLALELLNRLPRTAALSLTGISDIAAFSSKAVLALIEPLASRPAQWAAKCQSEFGLRRSDAFIALGVWTQDCHFGIEKRRDAGPSLVTHVLRPTTNGKTGCLMPPRVEFAGMIAQPRGRRRQEADMHRKALALTIRQPCSRGKMTCRSLYCLHAQIVCCNKWTTGMNASATVRAARSQPLR
ncbi:ATP-binding protein [Paraburkholderia tropica]|uniref:ATP-binding protein n=1 Tax=Paraburkholderia tropica TaxID=92647 RepID=UPI0012EA2106|nr:ATP-binding protein [Paraburkholderia tropica]